MSTYHRPRPISEQIPCQPIELDDEGVVRFRANGFVRWMYDRGSKAGLFRLDDLADLVPHLGMADFIQLTQLLGRSVSGYQELDYVPDEEAERAQAEAEKFSRSPRRKKP